MSERDSTEATPIFTEVVVSPGTYDEVAQAIHLAGRGDVLKETREVYPTITLGSIGLKRGVEK
jgi:hypothetical protein